MEDRLSFEGVHGNNGDSGAILSPIVLIMLPKKKLKKKKKKKSKKRHTGLHQGRGTYKKKSVKSVYVSM